MEKLIWKIRQFNGETWLVILSLIIFLLNVIGSFVTLYALFNWTGVLIASIAATLLIIVGYIFVSNVVNKTMRGTRLINSIDIVGLHDIENRDDKAYLLPPPRLFNEAVDNVIIIAYSGKTTFDLQLLQIKNLLKRGVYLKLVLLYPGEEVMNALVRRGNNNIKDEILKTIEIIRHEGIYEPQKNSFKIKFAHEIPPYTGIMVDGDVEHPGMEPRDKYGFIRIQPATQFHSQHGGLVIHLKKRLGKKEDPKGVFDYYADDIRKIWKDSKYEPDLLN